MATRIRRRIVPAARACGTAAANRAPLRSGGDPGRIARAVASRVALGVSVSPAHPVAHMPSVPAQGGAAVVAIALSFLVDPAGEPGAVVIGAVLVGVVVVALEAHKSSWRPARGSAGRVSREWPGRAWLAPGRFGATSQVTGGVPALPVAAGSRLRRPGAVALPLPGRGVPVSPPRLRRPRGGSL